MSAIDPSFNASCHGATEFGCIASADVILSKQPAYTCKETHTSLWVVHRLHRFHEIR